jgi:hypothetical protein
MTDPWKALLQQAAERRVNILCAPADEDRVCAAVASMDSPDMHLVRPDPLIEEGTAVIWRGPGEQPPPDALRVLVGR